MKVVDNFNKTFWNGEVYRSPGYEGETDDRCHALAVVCGLAEPEKYDAIRKVLKTEYHASPYMEKYVLEALYIMRFEDDAIQRIKERYEEMVAHSHTTLWEDWRIGGSGGGTINHAWSGGPLTALSQYVAGIALIRVLEADVVTSYVQVRNRTAEHDRSARILYRALKGQHQCV